MRYSGVRTNPNARTRLPQKLLHYYGDRAPICTLHPTISSSLPFIITTAIIRKGNENTIHPYLLDFYRCQSQVWVETQSSQLQHLFGTMSEKLCSIFCQTNFWETRIDIRNKQWKKNECVRFWFRRRFAGAWCKSETHDGKKPKSDSKWQEKSRYLQSVWKGGGRNSHQRSHWIKPSWRNLASLQCLWKYFQVKESVEKAQIYLFG